MSVSEACLKNSKHTTQKIRMVNFRFGMGKSCSAFLWSLGKKQQQPKPFLCCCCFFSIYRY